MKINNHIQVDSVSGLAVGYIQITVEEEEDLYHIFRLLSRPDDICISPTTRNTGKRKINCTLEMDNLDPYFDGINLTINGVVRALRKPVKAGSHHTFKIERNACIKLSKAQWDNVDMVFLNDSRKMALASVSPIVVVLLNDTRGEIKLIDQSCATSLWSITRSTNEVQVFDGVMNGLISNICINSVKSIIVASSDGTQNKFLRYLSETSKREKAMFDPYRSKFCVIEVPVPNRDDLRSILMKSSAIRRINKEHKWIQAVEGFERFRKHMGRTSHDPDYVFLNRGHIKDLILSEEVIKVADRREHYCQLLKFMEENHKRVTLFSPYHPGHDDLMMLGGVAATFAGLRVED